MNGEFVPYQQSLELKELGFNEEVLAWYNPDKNFIIPLGKKWITIDTEHPKRNSDFNYEGSLDFIAAPLYQQAFRWFREKYGLYSEIFVDDNKTFGFYITSFIEEGRLDKPITRQFNTYDEAELGCVKQLIEIIDRKAEAYQ